MKRRKRKIKSMPGLRQKILKTRINICEACGTTENLCIHHKNAICIFPSMKKDPDNIALLCRKCHDLFHQMYGTRVTESMYNTFLMT